MPYLAVRRGSNAVEYINDNFICNPRGPRRPMFLKIWRRDGGCNGSVVSKRVTDSPTELPPEWCSENRGSSVYAVKRGVLYESLIAQTGFRLSLWGSPHSGPFRSHLRELQRTPRTACRAVLRCSVSAKTLRSRTGPLGRTLNDRPLNPPCFTPRRTGDPVVAVPGPGGRGCGLGCTSGPEVVARGVDERAEGVGTGIEELRV